MKSDASALLKRARDLFQQGFPDQAEEIVGLLLRDDPRDATALNFRAYLLYKRGSLEDAVAAYLRLTELEPGVAGHLANLGLICFKAQRYGEAQSAFERQLVLQPGDTKALRNLGFCHERQHALDKALDCFTRAGDEEHAAGIRELLVRPSEGAGARGGGAVPNFGGAPARAGDGQPAAPEAVPGADVAEWLERASLPRPGEGPEFVRAGLGELMVKLREKVFVNPMFCIGHRGVVVFAPATREAEKASSKLGGRHGILARAEGNGEFVLSGRGRGLHVLRLNTGRLFVNAGALVLCGTEIEVSFEYAGLIKEKFLAAQLGGSGQVVLAARGAPIVLPVLADLPTLVRPEAIVAWTEGLGYEAEVVPELKKLVGKDEALRYRFEGRGYLVLQSC